MAENAGDLVVETYKLTKIYQNRQIALNDVTLKMEPGCVLGLLGHNGAGKTTLLRLILGPPPSDRRLGEGLRQDDGAQCGILALPHRLYPHQSAVPARHDADQLSRLHGPLVRVAQRTCVNLVWPRSFAPSICSAASGDPVEGFSNGMTARLAVATSLINEPDLLVWDEPTHGLDPEARRSMLELIKTLAKEKTLIVSSHNLSDIDEVCNHAAVLSRGHMIYFGSLQDLKGRMRKNHYELDLEGDQKAIAKAMQTIKGLADFKAVVLRQRRLELRLTDDANNASALANVFMTLADNKVTLVSIRSVGQQTEQAFLDLVEKEEARGFSRAYQNPAEAA